MINSPEFKALVDARCILAIGTSAKYNEIEEKLIHILKDIDPKVASQIDDLISTQQALVEQLVYTQGVKDGINLVNSDTEL